MSVELEAILNGEEVAAVEETPVETPSEPEAKAEEVPEEVKAEEAPKAEPEETKPVETASTEDKDGWQYTAYKDEKQKRQALEQELQALKQPKQETPDVFDDQAGFVNSLRSEMEQGMLQNKIELSRSMMIDAKPDYEAKELAFIELAKENPILGDQLKAHANPAKFVYDQAVKHEQFQQMQDVDTYKAKIEAEVRAKVEAEYKAKQEEEASKVSNLTQSLASAPSSGPSNTPVETTLESLFQT